MADNTFEFLFQEVKEIHQLLLNLKDGNSNPSGAVISIKEPPITTKQLCAHLGITEPTVIRWRKKGKIPFFQIGSAVRFDLAKVLKALDK